jgi:CMP-N,N'-diacetyllegionaminic acid synthase
MAWVLDALRESRLVTRTIVDTDDSEMAAVGRSHGAEVPYVRPAHLASPSATHVAVLTHALERLQALDDYYPDAVVLAQPTSPFVTAEHIDAAVTLLAETDADSVETVIEVPTVFHPYNVRVRDPDGRTRFLMPSERAAASEEGRRPQMYAIGNVYVFRPGNLAETGTIQGRVSRSFVVDRRAGFDVDDPFDLRIAEALAGGDAT